LLTSSQFHDNAPFPLTVTWGSDARFSTDAGLAAAEAARTPVTAAKAVVFMVMANVRVME
jgi:hypothetical protein